MTTATAPRKLVHFGSDIRVGQTITVSQVTGEKVTGTVKRITVPNRKTGQRKATLTNGRIVLVNTHEIIKVAR